MRTAIALMLMLAACSDTTPVSEAIGNSGQAGDPREPYPEPTAPLDPGTQPVRIGEAGANFAACATIGRVTNTERLAVRRAPFAEAAEVDAIAADGRVTICSRSLDQRWFGVVYPPADQQELDCGLARPVERRQGYEGPCRSGWVASAFIRLVGR